MPYELRFAHAAAQAIQRLIDGGPATAGKLKKVRKALGLLQKDPRYPALHSHLYQHFPGLEKGKVWDSYVENRTPGAWRIYWMYGPDEVRDGKETAVITVLVIGPHL
ncbi:MAG TPA: hypothetical protein VF054_17640 [Micromonosporaceae bacterium]